MVAKKLETKHECGLDRKLCMYLPCIARRTKKSKFLQGAGPGQQAGLAEANELLSLAYSLAHVLVCYVGAASIIPLQQHQESNLSHSHILQAAAGGSAPLPQHLSQKLKVLGVLGLVFFFL